MIMRTFYLIIRCLLLCLYSSNILIAMHVSNDLETVAPACVVCNQSINRTMHYVADCQCNFHNDCFVRDIIRQLNQQSGGTWFSKLIQMRLDKLKQDVTTHDFTQFLPQPIALNLNQALQCCHCHQAMPLSDSVCAILNSHALWPLMQELVRESTPAKPAVQVDIGINSIKQILCNCDARVLFLALLMSIDACVGDVAIRPRVMQAIQGFGAMHLGRVVSRIVINNSNLLFPKIGNAQRNMHNFITKVLLVFISVAAKPVLYREMPLSIGTEDFRCSVENFGMALATASMILLPFVCVFYDIIINDDCLVDDATDGLGSLFVKTFTPRTIMLISELCLIYFFYASANMEISEKRFIDLVSTFSFDQAFYAAM